MQKLIQSIITAVLILIIVSGLFALFSNPFEKIEEISLTQLVQKINAEEIAKITAQNNNLDIALKSGGKMKSLKEGETSLGESLKNYGVETEKLAKVEIEIKSESGFWYWVANILPFLLPLALAFFILWFIMRQAKQGTMQAFSFGKSGVRLFSKDKDRVTFKDVAGLKESKEELMEVVDFLKNPRKFLNIGARIPRGVLLMGPPGSGKTLLARAVAGEANVPFFHISGSEFVEMFVGVGASRVRDLFQTAKKSAPAIIFIDEIDAVGRQRGAGLGGGHDEREQTLNQILVEMDGFDRETNVIVMAATNRPDILDPALLRPGRFDRRIVLDLPDISERENILRLHAAEKPLTKDVDLKKVADRTPGFSGADLANLMNEAAILAARRNKKIIEQADIYESIEKVLLGPERKSHILTKKEKEIAAYHESGHALVAASLPGADPVHKVSIISRGRAAGYTLKLPTEDRHFRSRSEFLTDLAMALGGYAAEKLVFGEITTGASNDLEVAADLARRLVTQYGMSEKLGPVAFSDREEMVFLGRDIIERRDYSEEVAAEIDAEIKKFVNDAHKTAQKILTQKRKKLDEIAKRLIEKETIEKEEFEELVKSAR